MKGRARLRAFHVHIIHPAFERCVTKIKTFCDKFVNKKAAPKIGAALFFVCLAFSAHLSEALAAEYGTVGLGLEGNLCLAAATCAGSGEELTGTTGIGLTGVTACLAALGLILEAALCVEFLLTGGENEFVAALFAN